MTKILEPFSGDYTNPLDRNGRPFTWGPIQQIHYVGSMAFIEYLNDNSNMSGSDRETIEREHGQTQYQAYFEIEGHGWYSTNQSYLTLDDAVVGTICYRRDGANSQAFMMFCRMTNHNPYPNQSYTEKDETYEAELTRTLGRNREQAAARLAGSAN